MTTSRYMTVPMPLANMGSLIACLNALTHNVNLLIVNAQASQSPNLTGADSFVRTTSLDKQLSNINNQISNINNILAKNGIS